MKGEKEVWIYWTEPLVCFSELQNECGYCTTLTKKIVWLHDIKSSGSSYFKKIEIQMIVLCVVTK